MKCFGRSYNSSDKKKAGVLTRFKCKHCNKEYKMGWAKDNHEDICKEHNHK